MILQRDYFKLQMDGHGTNYFLLTLFIKKSFNLRQAVLRMMDILYIWRLLWLTEFPKLMKYLLHREFEIVDLW